MPALLVSAATLLGLVTGWARPRASADTALWRGETGDATGVLAELEQLLPDQTGVLGGDHPNTLPSRANIAEWPKMRGGMP